MTRELHDAIHHDDRISYLYIFIPGQSTLKPGIPGVEEKDAKLGFRKGVESTNVADDFQTDRKRQLSRAQLAD